MATLEGKAKVARNAYKGGDWLMLRNLSKVVNAEICEAREMVADCKRVGGIKTLAPANPGNH